MKGDSTLKKLKYWEFILAMMRGGVSTQRIRAYIQEVRGDMLEIKPASLIRKIDRARTAIPPETVLPPSAMDTLVSRLDIEIDAVQELTKLARYAMDRLELLAEIETRGKISLPEQRKNIELARETLAKIVETQMRLGILKEVPLQVEAKVNMETEMLLKGFAIAETDRNVIIGQMKKIIAYTRHKARKDDEVKKEENATEEEG